MYVEELYTFASVNEINGTGFDLLAGMAFENESETTVSRGGMLDCIGGLGLLTCSDFDKLRDVNHDDLMKEIADLILYKELKILLLSVML